MPQIKKHYLVTEKISKLMIKFSVPCTLSLLVASLYSIVDQIFIGHGVGYIGNGATNVVFPLTMLIFSVALMFGDGAAAFLSLSLGKNDPDSAHKGVGNAILVSFISGLVLTVIFGLFRDQLLGMFGATEANLAYAQEYFNYLLIGFPFYTVGTTLSSIIRADGSPQTAMNTMLVGCVVNVILDPVLIFVFNWGMMGAAVATIMGQIATALLTLNYLRKTKSFKLQKSSFKLKWNILKKTLPLGITSFLTQFAIVLIVVALNNVMVTYGAMTKYGSDIPLTVIGIVMKVFQIVIAIVVGIAVGCQPIIGFNYGVGAFDRVREIYKKMIVIELVVGFVAMFIFECFPVQVISLFGSESDLYNEFAVIVFRIFLATIVLCCVQKSSSIFLQALGKPVLSLGMSLLRDFMLLVPLIILLPRAFGLIGTLYSAPIADVVSLIAVVIVMKKVMGELKTADVKTKSAETSVLKKQGSRLVNQTIIINRQFASGGREVGKRLADALHIAYYDKDLLQAIAEKSGLSEDFVAKYDETVIQNYHFTFGQSFTVYEHSPVHQLLHAQSEILQQIAENENAVIIGRCADYILSDANPFKVFVYSSDMDARIKRCYEKVPEDVGVKTALEMKDDIQSIDKKRAAYYESSTGQIWNDMSHYNLCIDTSKVGVKGAVEIILSALHTIEKA
ncbi:MAG: MATE family efflux transporter [Bacillota bacterium]